MDFDSQCKMKDWLILEKNPTHLSWASNKLKKELQGEWRVTADKLLWETLSIHGISPPQKIVNRNYSLDRSHSAKEGES